MWGAFAVFQQKTLSQPILCVLEDLISTLPKNQADGDKWLVTEIIDSTLIWSPSMKNFHSTKHFLFLAAVAMETGFKDFAETGQNFSKRKMKIWTFHIDYWDVNTFHINL